MQASIIASEGGSGYYPANTLYAVRQSLKAGVDGVELDIHLTADGRFVAHHDYRLNKHLTKDSSGDWLTAPGPVIKNSTLGELRQFETGALNPDSKPASHYPSRASVDLERIATFEEIEETILLSGTSTCEFWFEAKTDPYDLENSSAAGTYTDHLARLLNNSPLLSRIVLIAFDWELLRLAKTKIPGVQTGFLTIDPSWLSPRNSRLEPPEVFTHPKLSKWFGSYNPSGFANSIPRAVASAGGTYWSAYFADISEENVLEAHALGIKVSAWGADTQEDILFALSTGIDSLTTGYVDRAQNRPDRYQGTREDR